MSDTVVDGHTDPGLQPERTALAWIRTAAALAVVALLCLRSLPGAPVVTPIAAGVALIVAGLIVALGRRRLLRSCRDFGGERARPQWVWNGLLVAQVLALAGSVAVAVVVDAL